MNRYSKTYAQPLRPEAVGPKSNKFTLDLAGLALTDEQLAKVRSEAVKAAMLTASEVLRSVGLGNLFDDFGTFSTFSTFSTFGSGVAIPAETPQDHRAIIEQTLGAKIAPAAAISGMK